VAHSPQILYIRALSTHNDSPAVTWADLMDCGSGN